MPLEGRAVTANELSGRVAVFLRVFEENFDGFDRHRAVAEYRNPRSLPGLNQFLKHENEFLRAFYSECGHYHAAAALYGCSYQIGKLRARIVFRMRAVPIC